MAKPKTRVVVRYEDADRLLFSIRENGDGGLTVILRDALNHEDHALGDIGITHHKFSIHVSQSSPGTTIARTQLLANGQTKCSAQFIKDSKQSLFCLIYSALSPDLDQPHYLARPRQRDTLARVGTFHRSDLATLIYHIVVCDHQHITPFVAGHSSSILTFTKWKIVVYSTYLNVPCSHFGRVGIPATRPPKTDGVIDAGYPDHLQDSDGAESLPADGLSKLLLEMNNQLSAQLMLKFSNAAPDKREGDIFMNHRLWFHPNIRSLLAERLGFQPGESGWVPPDLIKL